MSIPPLARAWLDRVARSAARERLVVRGSLLTATWCPGRSTEDVDHLALATTSVDALRALVGDVMATGGAPLVVQREEVIWAETPLPGLRLHLRDPGGDALQVDLGFGDPLTAPPAPIAIAGVGVLGVSRETMVAWKIHGLVEFGGKWRPKDLFDLALLGALPLDDAALIEATRVAFASRGTSIELTRRFLHSGEWGRSRGSRRKWETFRERYTGSAVVPPFEEVVTTVRARMRPVLEALGVRP